MKYGVRPILLLILVAVVAFVGRAYAQTKASLDPAVYVDVSLKSLSSVKVTELSVVRNFIAHQIALTAPDTQVAITTSLLSKLGAADRNTKYTAATILSIYPASWLTENTDADAQRIYAMFLEEKDASLKSAYDSALANAKGYYRDGIRDFVAGDLSSLKGAELKLRKTVGTFPQSLYAENSSFYVALSIADQYVLGGDLTATGLLGSSNAAFEGYIAKVEGGQFGKRDFYAAGYFYRGLNGWIQNNNSDALNWMRKGSNIFSDNEAVYVYQLIISPGVKTAVIDRFLPARSSFNSAIQFLNLRPVPQYPNSDALTKALQLL